jgi:hypothetical protein
MEALQAVEVLKDGASATYGAGAVGGVINFKTRRDIDAPQLSVQKQFYDGSDGYYKVDFLTGWVGDTSNLMFSASYSHEDPMLQSAREGILALGRAEGLAFFSNRDSSGNTLSRKCSYVIEGATPPARFWTFYAADRSLAMLAGVGRRRPAANSVGLLRNPDNSFAITVGPGATPGNWLSVAGDGPLVFVLTFYDTPVSSSAGIAEIDLPQVLRTGCHA